MTDNAAPPPPTGTVLTFSSDMLPEEDRFGRYLEEFGRKIARIEVCRVGDAPFRVQLSVMNLGVVKCISEDVSPGKFGRTKDLVTDGNDDLILIINNGPDYRSPSGVVVERGAVHLLDSSRPGLISAGNGGKILIVGVARSALMRLVPLAEDLVEAEVGVSPPAALLQGYAQSLMRVGSLSEQIATTVGQHLLDLVALSLGAQGEPKEVAEQRGLRAARYGAVCATIRSRLSDHSLSLTTVARAQGLSERYIQRLFEEAGTSFTAFLVEERLAQVYRLLANPVHRGRRIVDIAADCGFGDLSHFNRTFRRRFGMTPSEARERGLLGE